MQDILKNDHLLHGKNIEQLLIMRGLIKEQQRGQIEELLKLNAGSVSIDFDLKFIPERQQELKEQLIQQQSYSSKLALEDYKQATVIYVYQGKKISNLDLFKKYIKGSDALIVFCEDSHMRSIKSKIDKLLAEENPGKRRIDLISHDTVLINLYANAHSPQYTYTESAELSFLQERIKLKASKLPRVQVNDPLVLYYGAPPFSVITSRQCSEITAGYRTDYLYVVPQFSETSYSSHVIIN